MAAKDYRRLFWFVLVVSILVDQLVKAWVRHALGDNSAAWGSRPWPGVFEVTLTYNKGIAFGIFQGHGVWLAPVAIIMAVGAMWYSQKHPKDPASAHLAMGLLAAGALGNLIDRVASGKVTDMFYFRAINFPVFNIADSCITVAAALLIYLWTLEAVVKSKPGTPVPEKPADATSN